jgi:probable F420-dependent oxidoreductase
MIAYDHVLGAVHADRDPKLGGPYTEADPFHEPLVLFGYLAGVTRTLGLTTGVLVLPQRQTALVAKQAVEIDLLSGGRLRLGVEYQALGTRFEDRGRRFDEQIEVLRRLWREPVVDFEGRHHRIDRAGLLPRPGREIPVWFGALGEVAVKRAARVGDGILYGTRPSRVRRLHERFLEHVSRAGRRPEALGAEAVLDFADGPDVWHEEIRLWKELGGTHLSIRAMDTGAEQVGTRRMGYQGPGDYIRALETFHKEIG